MDNNLAGTIPVELLLLDHLEILDLCKFKSRNEGRCFNDGVSQKCHFSFLARNFLNGSIPSEIGETNALLELNLMSNNIQGQIPTALGKLGNLVSLDLSKCFIQVF